MRNFIPMVIIVPLLTMAQNSTETIFQCKASSRSGAECPFDHEPVCGFLPHVECTTDPCNYMNYLNSCQACRDPNVTTYTEGLCPSVPPEVVKCQPEDREDGACVANVRRVCGYLPDLNCTKGPCNFDTYINPCKACMNDSVSAYVIGRCTDAQLAYFAIFEEPLGKSGNVLNYKAALVVSLFGLLIFF